MRKGLVAGLLGGLLAVFSCGVWVWDVYSDDRWLEGVERRLEQQRQELERQAEQDRQRGEEMLREQREREW